jgi:hypothetical protein
MSADSMIAQMIESVPKIVAAGAVDMGTGLLLAIKTTESHPQSVMDMLAAATKELFEGDTVTAIEDNFRKDRGESGSERYFREIIVNSRNLIHCFSRLQSNQGVVICAVTRMDANLGLVVAKVREVAATGSA